MFIICSVSPSAVQKKDCAQMVLDFCYDPLILIETVSGRVNKSVVFTPIMKKSIDA